MKKVLAVAFALAIISLGFSASAQVPFVQVYFDDYGSIDQMDCPGMMADEVSVFAVNFNMWMAAIEYMIDYSPALTFLGDIMDTGVLSIGNSPTGIGISYPIPGNAWGPFRTQKASVFWNCTDCSGIPDTPVIVLPHPASGKVRAIAWPDLSAVDGVGMTSIICWVIVPTEETTWGNVKSLYNR